MASIEYYQLGFDAGEEDFDTFGFGSDIASAITALLPDYQLPLDKDTWVAFAEGYRDGSQMKESSYKHELDRVIRVFDRLIQRKSMKLSDKMLTVANREFAHQIKELCEDLVSDAFGFHAKRHMTDEEWLQIIHLLHSATKIMSKYRGDFDQWEAEKETRRLSSTLSDKLLTVAKWLESEENELLVEASSNEDHLNNVAVSLVFAAEALKDVANEIKETETNSSELTAEKLDEMAAVAAEFDASCDDLLQKQASVLDEILLTLAAPKNYISDFKQSEEEKLEVIKKKYKAPKEELDKNIGTKEAIEALNKSRMYAAPKKGRPLEYSLSTRYCPQHHAALLARVGDNDLWQCQLGHETYNFSEGYKLADGTVVPATSVDQQTPSNYVEPHQIFDSRSQRLGLEDQK